MYCNYSSALILPVKQIFKCISFSGFSRPGAVHLNVLTDYNLNEEKYVYRLMASAYRNSDGSVAVVTVKYLESELGIVCKQTGGVGRGRPTCRKFFL